MLSVFLPWYWFKIAKQDVMEISNDISIFNLIRTRRTKSFSFPVWLCRDFFGECITLFSISLRWIICILREGLIEKTVWIYDWWTINGSEIQEKSLKHWFRDSMKISIQGRGEHDNFIYIYKTYIYEYVYIHIYIYKRKEAFFGS